MSDNEITVALTRYPHTEALVSGKVEVAALPLRFLDIEGKLIETFRAMSRQLSFGISELGISTALIARDLGMPLKLLPLFVTRRFDHEAIFIHRERIQAPADLNGSTIGMRSYTVTDAVWSRAALSDALGIDLSSIRWIVTADEHIEGSRLPDNVEYRPGDVDRMLEQGEVDAILNPYRGADPAIVHLFGDFREAEHQWFDRTGYVPIHHVIVIRDDVLAAHPEAPSLCFRAFEQAKAPFLEAIRNGVALPEELNARHAYGVVNIEERLMDDPVPYGIEPNRVALEDVVRFAKEQEIIGDHWGVADLFLPISSLG